MSGPGDDVFARFAVATGKINPRTRLAHHKLFEPSEGKLSVQSTAGLDKDDLIKIGRKVASKREGSKHLHGWAKIARRHFLEIRLDVCIDNDPCPGHTTVKGWPDDRNKRIDIQRFLAETACVVPIPV